MQFNCTNLAAYIYFLDEFDGMFRIISNRYRYEYNCSDSFKDLETRLKKSREQLAEAKRLMGNSNNLYHDYDEFNISIFTQCLKNIAYDCLLKAPSYMLEKANFNFWDCILDIVNFMIGRKNYCNRTIRLRHPSQPLETEPIFVELGASLKKSLELRKEYYSTLSFDKEKTMKDIVVLGDSLANVIRNYFRYADNNLASYDYKFEPYLVWNF